MKRVGDLEYDRRVSSRGRNKWIRCAISDGYDPLSCPYRVGAISQRDAGKIRTDLNSFSTESIILLIKHGYNVANAVLKDMVAESGADLHHPPERVVDRLDDIGKFNIYYTPPIIIGLPSGSGFMALQYDAKRVRINLWRWSDWTTFVFVGIVLIYLLLLFGLAKLLW
jgi:hypothetical protein